MASLSPRAVRSTTRTLTPATTHTAISSVSRSQNTRTFTGSKAANAVRGRRRSRILNEFGHSQSRGTSQQRDANGIVSTQSKSMRSGRPLSGRAINAVRRTRPLNEVRGQGSVPTTASHSFADSAAWTTSNGSVEGAVRRLVRGNTPLSSAVALSVAGTSDAGTAPVFNLTVEGTPEYYANGVLVHNCDAMRYLCVGLTEGRPRVRVMTSR